MGQKVLAFSPGSRQSTLKTPKWNFCKHVSDSTKGGEEEEEEETRHFDTEKNSRSQHTDFFCCNRSCHLFTLHFSGISPEKKGIC